MFKTTLLSSTLLAVAQAITVTQPEIYSEALSLAQTTASGDCCCSYMPCMLTCATPCNESRPPPNPALPVPIQNIELNLDVILTHILHEQHPE